MTLIRAILFIVTFAALAVVVTLAACYFFPEVPKAWLAKDPWYEVRHAWHDHTSMLAFAGIGGVVGLFVFMAHWWVSQKLVHGRRLRSGLCLVCGYDLRGGHTACPECGSPAPSLDRKKERQAF